MTTRTGKIVIHTERHGNQMHAEFEVSFEGDYIKVIKRGAQNIQISTDLWTAVVAECNKRGCFKVLGISTTDEPLPTIDGYQHAELFKSLGIDHRYRLAWVEENPEAVDALYFAETVLINRGLPGRLFKSTGAALDWLLNEETANS